MTVLKSHLDNLLRISDVPDYSCNGLQVEGIEEISKVGLAVDACMKTYEKAHHLNCQLLLVHHGMIWGGLQAIRGMVYQQINFLMRHQINLYAAHLPLDMHEIYGNNIQLARLLRLQEIQPFGNNYKGLAIGFQGNLPKPMRIEAISDHLQSHLNGSSTLLPFGKKMIRSVGIISGGASKELGTAIATGLDCYITGEPHHSNHHTALEGHINVIYLGHYHSEMGGVIALGNHLRETFNLETVFLDEPTIV